MSVISIQSAMLSIAREILLFALVSAATVLVNALVRVVAGGRVQRGYGPDYQEDD